MIQLDTLHATVAGLILAVWLAAAIVAVTIGWRRHAAARAAVTELNRLRTMLAGAPALPMLVSADGRLRAHERAADWFGLDRAPRSLADLSAGLDPQDAEAFAHDVHAAQRSGASFARAVRPRGASRVLMVRGRPAAPALGEGAALLWLFDSTESEEEIARLTAERERLAGALDALAGLIEAAPIPMWHRGPDLRLSLVNSAYVHAVDGESAHEVIARGLELIEAQGAGGPIASAAIARDEGEMTVRTVPATIGGERRTLRVVDVPLGASGIAGYALDVEEVERARADLVRFEEAQRDMLDRLSAGVAQFAADRHLVFSNSAFQRLFAMLPEWLADRPEFDRVLERMREADRLPAARDFPGWKAERRRWFLSETAQEEAWQLPSGTHLRVVGQPLPDGGMLMIFEDRTEQVRLRSEADTLLRVRTATFNNLNEAVGVFAADGRLHLWNNRFREVWALTEEELARHPRVDALVGMVGPRLANPARAGLIRELVRLATGERQSRAGRIAFADGRHFQFAAVPLPDGNALFTLLDISDSRRAEQALRDRAAALEEGDRVKSAFVATMSYELKTPLTSIGGFAEMLAAGFAGPLSDRAGDYVGSILTAATRLGQLVDEVLDLTRSAAGRLDLEQVPIELAGLCRGLLDELAGQVKSRKLELIVAIEPSSGVVTGDVRRLRQAIDHVLRNAVDYTPEGGRILFHAAGDAEQATVVVSDDGEGISPEEQARAFDPFHRAGARGNRREGSIGLGLPLTRHYVEAHGGSVSLESAKGEGTTVTLHLPRARP
ncbi:PAS domain-containing sensor histidine kinase [uncultured Sphingomonas sp.]|uniref:sensor histidine kinase n=1 Tax=uncultured Sphingomonas sp. TaxID=158754 RepID=UPI002613A917|nr:PAS domain-containing sensor histidine kinase [uncultured Sphingomonas sp.]